MPKPGLPASRTIALKCPGCRQNLELDAGFAGGVCRCFSCGTLMTVPSESQTQPERLIRPARPEGPALSRRSQHGGNQDQHAVFAAFGVYTTDSGRTIEIDERSTPVPTATRRRVARWSTYGVFFLLVFLVLALCAFAIAALRQQKPPTPLSERPPLETFIYDPGANPFTLPLPNALGLPLRPAVAVIVDAADESRPWLDDVGPALQAGLTRPSESRGTVIYATVDGSHVLDSRLTPLSTMRRDDLASLHARVTAAGQPLLRDAVTVGIASGANHLILITSRRIDQPQARAIREALLPHPNIIFDIIILDRESVLLNDLARETTGLYVRLTANQLAAWRSAAESPAEEPPADLTPRTP